MGSLKMGVGAQRDREDTPSRHLGIMATSGKAVWVIKAPNEDPNQGTRVQPAAPPRRPNAGAMPRRSTPYGRASSVDGVRPNAAALNSRQLTAELGKARALPQLLSLHERHSDRFDHFNLGAFWSKFQKMPHGQLRELTGCLGPACEQTVQMLPELDARAVANVAHAFAKARLVGSGPWQNVWATLPDAVRRRLGDFNPQGLSNTAWAFASAGHASTELFNAISAEVVRRGLGDFKEQHLSNTAWAFATAGHASPQLFNAISTEVVRRELSNFKEQHLSNTAWAFATAGHLSAELFKAIAAEVVRRELGDFKE